MVSQLSVKMTHCSFTSNPTSHVYLLTMYDQLPFIIQLLKPFFYTRFYLHGIPVSVVSIAHISYVSVPLWFYLFYTQTVHKIVLIQDVFKVSNIVLTNK
jgi:hypothetical protein